MTEVVWIGELTRGEQPGTIVGHLSDTFGWRIEITGTLRPEGGYTLSATVGDPGRLALPLLDEKTK